MGNAKIETVKKLYIIGNGFDLHHKLKTSYCDFHQFVDNRYPDLIDFFDNYFELNVDKDGLWNQFEKDLGTFNHIHFFKINCHVDLAADNLQYNSFFGLEDELEETSERFSQLLREAFLEWLKEIEIITSVNFTLDKDAFFLTFNYTHLLEKHYKIPVSNILHLHGDIENEEFIVGHNFEIEIDPEFDENGDSNRTMLSDSHAIAKRIFYDFQKPVKNVIDSHRAFFVDIKSAENIYVLGHSLNEIDQTYFSEIIKNQNAQKWYVTYFKNYEKENFKSILISLGLDASKIEMITF